MNRKGIIAVAAVAGGLLVAGGGTAAYAITSPGGPPTVVSNHYSGAVNECVNQKTQTIRVETKSLVPDNCAAGEVQLTVVAQPQDASGVPAS